MRSSPSSTQRTSPATKTRASQRACKRNTPTYCSSSATPPPFFLPPPADPPGSQNKWEHVSERALDDVLEHLNTLNELTPKIRCTGKSVDPALIFGIDSKLFCDGVPPPTPEERGTTTADGNSVAQHHDEVETVTLLRGAAAPAHVHTESCNHAHAHPHTQDSTAIPHDTDAPLPTLDEPALAAALGLLPKEYIYRVKGFVRFSSASPHTAEREERSEVQQILNWAFGRWELVRVPESSPEENGELVRLTVMGERGEVRRYARKLAQALGAEMVA
jgi:G3E family GTPase